MDHLMDKQSAIYTAFLKELETHKGIIYKISYSFCKTKADCQDLTQEIIIKLWQSFGTYRSFSKTSTWIYRVSLNTAISFYRKEKTRNRIITTTHDSLLQLAEAAPAANRETDEKIAYLHQFLLALKEMDRALMILYLEGKALKEIAEIMGISPTNVSTKINRIKVVLKERFSKLNF
ncbi:sigma-70 family RNA polymerase sigma factor [Arachidicoccus ginsenosidivorans]